MKCWCWSLRSVFMHLYKERVLYMYMKEHDAFISSYVADSQELTEDEKVLSFTHYGFKNTMLLTPWCQKRALPLQKQFGVWSQRDKDNSGLIFGPETCKL